MDVFGMESKSGSRGIVLGRVVGLFDSGLRPRCVSEQSRQTEVPSALPDWSSLTSSSSEWAKVTFFSTFIAAGCKIVIRFKREK